MKEILECGENLGKPGRPYIVTVSVKGYFAKYEPREQRKAKLKEIRAKQREKVRVVKKKKRAPRKQFAEDGEDGAPSDSGSEYEDSDEEEAKGAEEAADAE